MTTSTIPRAPGGYGTLLVDPPWSYAQKLEKERGLRGGLPYESLTDEEILTLPVGELAAPDAILLLWTTNSHLPLALECVRRWGFTYRVLHTVVKRHVGLGYWLRGRTEHVIIATRGHPPAPFGHKSASGRTWTTAGEWTADGHSTKPAYVWQMAEDIGPPGPRVELFARGRRSGWVSWGNQVAKTAQTSLPDA